MTTLIRNPRSPIGLLVAASCVAVVQGRAESGVVNESVQAVVSETQLSGYVSTSAIWKIGTGNAVPFRSYDGLGKQDGFNLDAVNLTLSRKLDDSEWGVGYKAEMIFGPDGNALLTASTAGNIADFNVKQAYLELRAPIGNGLEFKIGTWDTFIGYEYFNAGENANYSRSIGYLLEPMTYTGVLMNYPVTDAVTLTGGIANPGIAATINSRPAGIDESEKSFMGGITLTAPESWGALADSSLTFSIIDHAMGSGPANIINWYAGLTFYPGTKDLELGVAYDYQSCSATPGFGSFYANSIAGYASYRLSEKVRLNLRGEYASGSSGTFGNVAPLADPAKFAAGSNTEIVGLTFTVDYNLWENVLSRVEFRWDSDVSGGPRAFGVLDKHAVSLALNVIYNF